MSVSKSLKLLRLLLKTEIPLWLIVFLSSIFSVAASSNPSLVYGFSHQYLENFLVWQFSHIKLEHFAVNLGALTLLLGSAVKLTLFDILLCSFYAYLIGFFDASLFYGMSGLVFFLSGKLIKYSYSYFYLYNYRCMPVHYGALFAASLMLAVIYQPKNDYAYALHLLCFLTAAIFSFIDGINDYAPDWAEA